MNLTQKACDAAAEFASKNLCSLAIDATCGNGFDTLNLAKILARPSKIFAFDIQQSAVDGARRLLEANGLSDCAQFFRQSHSRMAEFIESKFHGKINIAVFNLGWLPRSDKSVITRPESTIAALESLRVLLDKSKNFVSVISYRGHEGGEEEFEAVKRYLAPFEPEVYTDSANPKSPVLFLYSLRC